MPDNRVIAAMLTAGALGDQSARLMDDAQREEAGRWIVATYRAVLKELDGSEPPDEPSTLGFSIR